ncbi:acetylcholine receptor subunit beta-type unc-29-like [Ylistrum balloti]|uniref:acetylcholine receptor subunit beta-type unc-29-like n=1 Tax=Ylistrum balloti TaxID=509963 RepID=UPI002905F086|nr:acetylcholine receptor subunit beta-type unc-29-like [Ylistrum balloti]
MMWLLLLLAVSTTTTYGTTHENLTRLYQTLTSNYNKELRPTSDLSQPTRVYVGFQILSLKEFDEKTSKFAIVGMFIFSWIDFRMKWNPDEFGGIEQIFIRQSLLWTPDMILLNPYDKIEPPGYDSLRITVNYYGTMLWVPPDVFEVTCPADVKFYPFDRQMCSLYFSAFMMTVSDVFLESMPTNMILDYYYPNSLWDVTNANMSVVTELESQTFVVTMFLQRRPMFQIINTIVPFSILGLLNIMVFLLPFESGERVGFSVTVLLAVAVFMTIVADTLPVTSEPSFPRLFYILTTELCVNALVTISTILVLRLHYKPDHQTVPLWLNYAICKCICSHRNRKIENATEINMKKDLNNQAIISIDNITSKNHDAERSITKSENDHKWNNITVQDNQMTETKRKQFCDKTSWRSFAKFLDVFLFVMFFICFGSLKIVAYFVFSQANNSISDSI